MNQVHISMSRLMFISIIISASVAIIVGGHLSLINAAAPKPDPENMGIIFVRDAEGIPEHIYLDSGSVNVSDNAKFNAVVKDEIVTVTINYPNIYATELNRHMLRQDKNKVHRTNLKTDGTAQCAAEMVLHVDKNTLHLLEMQFTTSWSGKTEPGYLLIDGAGLFKGGKPVNDDITKLYSSIEFEFSVIGTKKTGKMVAECQLFMRGASHWNHNALESDQVIDGDYKKPIPPGRRLPEGWESTPLMSLPPIQQVHTCYVAVGKWPKQATKLIEMIYDNDGNERPMRVVVARGRFFPPQLP